MRLPRMKPALPAYFLALLSGALIGTGLDRLHVAGGTLSYSGTDHAQPWWVPVEFALVFVALLWGVCRMGDPLPDSRSPRRALGELVAFAAAYAFTAWQWRQPALVTVVLIVALVFRIGSLQRTGAANPVPLLALVVAGPLVEGLLSGAGLFRYTIADVVRIPLWLPVLYMHAAPFVIRGVEAMLWLTRPRAAEEAETEV